MIELKRGNLLEADAEALVNTVNTVGVMGKGIALQFKKAFPDNFQAYKAACDSNAVEIGHMFVFDRETMINPRFIINFPTKRHWRAKSRLADVDVGLRALVAEVRSRKIRSIAVPPLGAGLGGLRWSDVRTRIEQAFADSPDVNVMLYEPAGAPPPDKIIVRTKKPRMTRGRAALIGLMDRYMVPGYGYLLSLLEIQKLAYLLQVTGEPLRLNFVKERYGPYADNLRHVLSHLEGHYCQGFGDGRNSPDTPMRLLEGAADAAEKFLVRQSEIKKRFDRVTQVIEGFETPYGMELLASVHWVANDNPRAALDPEIAVADILDWSDRKRRMMKPRHIRIGWDRLREQAWI
ncbi:MAG TPA: macro domain-containing protein [Alphaproteobacteria bacterium]|nr:macro domain-containing protein [Alphaproteobacteria bacterium]